MLLSSGCSTKAQMFITWWYVYCQQDPLLSLQDGRDRGRVGQGVGGRGEGMGGGVIGSLCQTTVFL